MLLLGRVEEAKAAVRHGVEALGEIPSLCFAAANAIASDDFITPGERDRLCLEWINKCLLKRGFAPLALRDPAHALTIDNLVAVASPCHDHKSSAKLTVIMTAYNAARTIVTALHSVLRQTWSNLEVLLVDDASTDQTWSIVRSVAENDGRIVCLRHNKNRGTYAARNTALAHATGEFITVHDADDWSHPQRFAVQLADLIDSGAPFNTTAYIAVDSHMKMQTLPAKVGVFREAFSSLTFRCKDAIALGGWDEVRISADAEIYHRLMALHRAGRRKLFEDTPLTFSLVSERNLTSHRFSGVASLVYGARREYREAFQYWHSMEEAKAQPELTMTHRARPFPAPSICRKARNETLRYDILLVSDYSLLGDAAWSNVDTISSANAQGLRVACFHWPLFDNAFSPLNPKVRALIHEGAVGCIVAGESVECDSVVVVQPAILNYVPHPLPRIKTNACLIGPNGGFKYDLDRVIETARVTFGVEPTGGSFSRLSDNRGLTG